MTYLALTNVALVVKA